MSAFQSIWNPQGAGANYGHLISGVEDDIFHEGAVHTQWKQNWTKYTPHQAAILLQWFQSAGLSRNNIAYLNKTPDFLYSAYVLQHYPAIRPNVSAGVEETSWVNCPSLYAIRQLVIKIGSQTLFSMDGHAMLVLCELMGLLDHYACMLGFNMTRAQQIKDSKRDRNLYAPFVGFPFHERPDQAFNIGSIAFHQVTCELLARPLNEMINNWGGVSTRLGLYALPVEVKTNATVTPTSVELALATNCVWVSAAERLSLVHGYNETLFKEIVKAAEYTVPASSSSQLLSFELNIKGPTAYIFVTITSQGDIDKGLWTKLCQDSGEDHISEMMLITGSTPREDGLPVEAYRTLKVMEVFHVSVRRHIYVLGFETDDRSRQMTGHQNMTNAERLKFEARYRPHASPLVVRVDASVYNGWYTENGSGGRVWGS